MTAGREAVAATVDGREVAVRRAIVAAVREVRGVDGQAPTAGELDDALIMIMTGIRAVSLAELAVIVAENVS